MKWYNVRLVAPMSTSFRCQKAADSLDINTAEKSVHELRVQADVESPFSVGLIVGSSGSGKTTLARQIYGANCFDEDVNRSLPVIEQFPTEMSYDECSAALLGIGLTSVPCWIRPMHTLSNGQQSRAIAALRLHQPGKTVVIDEWTSVVDRTVAKVMSHCVQKHARKTGRQIVLVSCHYDIIDWVNPDWIIDCNKQTFEDRRLLRPERTEKLAFDIRETDSKSWKVFSKYHYLSSALPGGRCFFYGLFHGKDQIGFQCYTSYLPGRSDILYSNRVVIHPDYAGLGLGIRFIDSTAGFLASQGFKIRATFSSIPLYKARMRNPSWRLVSVEQKFKSPAMYDKENKKYSFGRSHNEKNTFRSKVTVFMFEWIGGDR